MYPISVIYADYLKRHDREFKVRATVGNEEYDNTRIVDFQIENSLTLGDEFELGTAIPSKLTIRLRTQEVIQPNARIAPYLALDTSGLTWNRADYRWDDAAITWGGGGTEWLPLGEFFVDSRERVNDIWTFVCYDKLVWADTLYVPAMSFPATQQAVFNEICGALGMAVDSSVVIHPSYIIQQPPSGYSMRQVLGFIAAANCSSLYVSKDYKVKFRRFTGSMTPVYHLTPSDYIRVKQTNPVKSYTRIVVTVDSENDVVLEAGEGDENHTLYLVNPFATQAIVNSMQATLNGFAYMPLSMDSRGFPHLEQGDIFTYDRDEGKTWLETQTPWALTGVPWDGINTYQSIILHQVLSFKGGLKMSIEARSASEQKSEFPVTGPLANAVDRLNKTSVKEGKRYYGASLTREQGLTIDRSDGKARAVFNADELTFYKGTQKALWFDVPSDRYKFAGTLEAVDGVFSGRLEAATGTFSGDLSAAGGTFRGALQAASGSFKGELQAATGTFTGDLSAAGGTFRGALQAASGTFTGDLSAAGGTFRGALQAASGTFSGDLSAAGGTFSGNLSAAGGTFTGTLVGVDGNFSGTITASSFVGGQITGALIRTELTGQRIEMSVEGFKAFDSSGNKRLTISNDGFLGFSGFELWGPSGGRKGGLYADDSMFFLSGTDALQILSFNDRVHFAGRVDFEDATITGIKQSAVTGLDDKFTTKANVSSVASNMTFDPTTRNLKMWSQTGDLLAQVNIPK